jgi:GNAT superfamily N-acetyltransferase
VEIRRIAESELTDLLLLYEYLHDIDDPLPEQDVVESTWGQMQSDPNHYCFGAFADSILVSACSLVIIPNLTRGCRPYGLIENVVTHGEYRRKGLGREVLRAALACAWGRNCYKVMLLTGRKSDAVFRFYESAGFDGHAKRAFLAKPEPDSPRLFADKNKRDRGFD